MAHVNVNAVLVGFIFLFITEMYYHFPIIDTRRLIGLLLETVFALNPSTFLFSVFVCFLPIALVPRDKTTNKRYNVEVKMY